MDEMDLIRAQMKRKRKQEKKEPYKVNWRYQKVLGKFLLTALGTICALILLKGDVSSKKWFYQHVYETNFSFMTVNQWYEKTFGGPLPFQDLWKDKVTTPVFDEKLEYRKKEAYQEGVKLEVNPNYLIPNLESGMVVFIGEKEGYGNTVIVQQVNGVDAWYANVKNNNVKLYDYVEKGSLLGEVEGTTLYLVFKKEGTALNYEDYI